MKLSFIIIATSLVIAVVAFPSKDSTAIDFDKTELLENVEERVETALDERPRACSKQIGQSCTNNCECCGATVVCASVHVQGQGEKKSCKSKTSNNGILDLIGQAANAVENAASMCV
uniref:U100-Liphistoxin-Lth1a_1 n=1 Tax=Liphistius thaleban TaxID=1905330 RepID=A0A4Q8K1T3_9ARAC